MKQFLDRLILGLPVLFLKQYRYAWIAVVAFWPRSPSIALLFLAVVVIGILSLRWQAAAWISQCDPSMRLRMAGSTLTSLPSHGGWRYGRSLCCS